MFLIQIICPVKFYHIFLLKTNHFFNCSISAIGGTQTDLGVMIIKEMTPHSPYLWKSSFTIRFNILV